MTSVDFDINKKTPSDRQIVAGLNVNSTGASYPAAYVKYLCFFREGAVIVDRAGDGILNLYG